MQFRWFFMAVMAVALTSAAYAQGGRNRLNVGDEAPKLDIERWVDGDEHAELEQGNVYIIEFWATWCAPCRKAIPFLSYLQKTYADDGLVIIGVSDEKPETVQQFVQQNPTLFSYTVAVDNKENTKRSWMQAAGREGFPTMFIVDRNGKIQYIGHPQGDDSIEWIVQLVLQDRYNPKLFRDVRSAVDAAENALIVKNWRLALRHMDQIIEHDSHVFAFFNVSKFRVMLVNMDNPELAYAFARETIEKYATDAPVLVELAKFIATDSRIDPSKRDLDVAMEAAQAAAQAGRANDPTILSVQALVHFHKGDVDQAISLQRRAWMIAPPQRKASYERALRDYQESRLRASRMEMNRE